MKRIAAIWLLTVASLWAQSVSVTNLFGGDPGAAGVYTLSAPTTYTKGTYNFTWDGAGEWDLDDQSGTLETASGGTSDSPATANWTKYKVTVIAAPGTLPSGSGSGSAVSSPGTLNPVEPGVPDKPENYVGTFSQSLTDAQKSRARKNVGLANLGQDFYDTFDRVETTGTMGTPDSGGSYFLFGNGAAGVKAGNGRYYNSGAAGAGYATTKEPGYAMCGAEIGWTQVTSTGAFGDVALLLSPTQTLGDQMIHAIFNRAGVAVHAVATGGVGGLTGANLLYSETAAYRTAGDVVEIGIAAIGDRLIIRDTRLPGGQVIIRDSRVAAITSSPLYPIFEVFNQTSGLQGEFYSVWASANPNFAPSNRSGLLARATQNGEKTIFPGYLNQDRRNRGYQFPGHLEAHGGLDRVPTEYIDFVDIGDGGLSSSSGDINLEFPVSELTGTGQFVETDDEMIFEVWGRCIDPEVGDTITWRLGTTNYMSFAPPDGGSGNIYVGFHFRWVVRRMLIGGTARYAIVATGHCDEETPKTVCDVTYNFTSKPNIQMTGDCWRVYSARALRK